MLFQQKIESYLKELQGLTKSFQAVQDKEVLPLSFFASTLDALHRLKTGIYEIEEMQLQVMQEHFNKNRSEGDIVNETNVDEQPVETKTVPETEEKIAPTIEEKIIPIIEEKIVSIFEERIAPMIKERITPKVEKKAAPVVEETIAPKVEAIVVPPPSPPVNNVNKVKTVPKVETLAAPVVDVKTAPVVNVLADKIGRKINTDIKKSLSINDRFRFQRDLFQGSANEMNQAFAQLNTFLSLNEALEYLSEKYTIPWDDDSGIAFKELLLKRFA